MLEIDIDEAIELSTKRRDINRISIMDAIFMRNGKEILVANEARNHWRFTGLNTIDFVLATFE